MIKESVVKKVDEFVQSRFRNAQRRLLPQSMREMAENVLAFPGIREKIEEMGIAQALETAQRVHDFGTIAAIAYLKGFSRHSAVTLIGLTARDYIRRPTDVDISGHKFSMKELERRAVIAIHVREHVKSLNYHPREKDLVARSHRILAWQRRYNKVRKFFVPQPKPNLAAA